MRRTILRVGGVWYRWFAWRPVFVENQIVWLEHLWRTRYHDWGDWDYKDEVP